MSNTELAEVVRAGGPNRGKAVFELGDRAAADDKAATVLGELTMLPVLRNDRLHLGSLAWAALIGRLSATGRYAAVP
ncbi:hypothetical protein HC028_21085 [Planosporangium flavigriseum]|uniref:Uncharacterized protein n=1 Tax=Planosporangium flavigriseum TaxID=373681 RepID=A0A8J3LNJ4_9ACTN|nr:hypothetical protein [Planosporangium flavigriseum]NJC66979.1 hypothetical protein [Planosporangium flavigriseum]GIG73955.1 hypothetical protein Pfl04_23590 [Planosporangium flavigriseum]